MPSVTAARGLLEGEVSNKTAPLLIKGIIGMAILKANARHVLRRLEIIVPQAIHTHVARRAQSEAAREADFDEHRADVRGFGCDGGDCRDYAYCA